MVFSCDNGGSADHSDIASPGFGSNASALTAIMPSKQGPALMTIK
jgi:hypothetical protein